MVRMLAMNNNANAITDKPFTGVAGNNQAVTVITTRAVAIRNQIMFIVYLRSRL
jgi:hypothetical protein